MMQTAPIPVLATPSHVELLKPEATEQEVDVETESAAKEDETPSPSILHDLSTTDRLLITKRLRVRNVMILRGKRKQFHVRTPDHKLIYTIEEENSWWVGYFFLGLRPLQLHVFDSQGREVMRINRPFACTARMFPCQLQKIEVFSPPGQKIGSVEQQWTALRPVYVVKDAEGEEKFRIRGPLITLSCYKDVEFFITRTDGEPVGCTNKRWQGLAHAMFFAPVMDRFGVAYERDLTLEEKALLLAATILFDYMYYDV